MRLNDNLTTKQTTKAAVVCFLGFVMATLPETGFAGVCDRVTALENYNTTGFSPIGAMCKPYVGLANVQGISCRWEFPFRDAEANRAFNDLWTEVTRCKDGTQKQHRSSVNHPDSYVQRKLITSDGVYRVAQKDKGQINLTLVFLSLEHRN
ncbi:hypothetical protein [uncultured Ruegeria sp.]|uniref:hypothetical protein n=1 Tax=uncultured Ruegeria sp. TaxID=259304 RepID=UPI00263676B8|nr:hypothetical protein [uncultured Ruegeria sp.]